MLRGDLVRETFSFFTLFPALLGAKAPSHHPALGGADGFFFVHSLGMSLFRRFPAFWGF